MIAIRVPGLAIPFTGSMQTIVSQLSCSFFDQRALTSIENLLRGLFLFEEQDLALQATLRAGHLDADVLPRESHRSLGRHFAAVDWWFLF
jgi:hypothetical protein